MADLLRSPDRGGAGGAKWRAGRRRCPPSCRTPAEEALRQVLYDGGSPVSLKAADMEPYFEASAQDALKPLREKAAQLRETMPPSPDYAMVMNDAPEPVQPARLPPRQTGQSGRRGAAPVPSDPGGPRTGGRSSKAAAGWSWRRRSPARTTR